jgi:hypothetical protein
MNATILLDILLALGAAALILGFTLHKIQTIAWVRQYGTPVTAYVTRINRRRRSLVNSFSIVTAQWTEPRSRRTYTFDGISAGPGLHEGSLVTVLVDLHHPRHYVMDVQ